MTSGNSKPSVFTTTTCEFLLPAGATTATVAGIKLPLPKPVVNRVVIVGDTGCRISIGNVYQACGDPTAVALLGDRSQAAAAMQPDLVLHVGDYEYRDNPCPPGNTACAGDALGLRLRRLGGRLLRAGGAAAGGRALGHGPRQPRGLQPRRPGLVPVPRSEPVRRHRRQDLRQSGERQRRQLQRSRGRSPSATRSSSRSTRRTPRRPPIRPPAFQPYTERAGGGRHAGDPANLLNIFAVHHPVLGYSAANPPTHRQRRASSPS